MFGDKSFDQKNAVGGSLVSSASELIENVFFLENKSYYILSLFVLQHQSWIMKQAKS